MSGEVKERTKNMSFWSKLSGLIPSDIFAAVRKGDLEKVKALLEGNPGLVFKTDSQDWTPLHSATHWHQKDAAELLLANKAEVGARYLAKAGFEQEAERYSYSHLTLKEQFREAARRGDQIGRAHV